MVRNILIGVAAFFVALVAIGFLLPNRTQVSESVVISAPPAAVYATLDSLKEFNEWSPWAKMEPSAAYTFEGPEQGVGMKMSWDGKTVGKGSQTIVRSSPERIDLTLTFDGQGGGNTWYLIVPEGEGTHVTWVFESDPYGYNLIGRYFGAIALGGMLSKQYAQGLADLKTYQEAKPAR